MSEVTSYLFETKALKICPENKPFWYTSGKIGPYFINTHFIYGSEEEANELLKFIDAEKENKEELPKKVYEKTMEQYRTSKIYKTVIDEMIAKIKQNINVDEIDFVSGGERRDWFFSYAIADLLGKSHITIFKDLTTVVTDSKGNNIEANLEGKKVLHAADLITEASSYIRAWIPAIKQIGAEIKWSIAVVDRMQGGKDKLQAENIKSYEIIRVDNELFEEALSLGIINKEQLDMLVKFKSNPDGTMRDFLVAHPEFLENALKADEKTAGRAKLCKDGNLYNL